MRPLLRFTLCALLPVFTSACRTADTPDDGSQAALENVEDPGCANALALAALLLRDAHYERAEATLADIDPATHGLDRGRLFTLRGLTALHRQDYERARDELLKAIGSTGVDRSVGLYLAQAHYALKDHASTLTALEHAEGTWEEKPGVHRMVAHCRWAQGDPVGTFAALRSASQRFPTDPSFAKQRVLYLIEMGLFVEAASAGQIYLETAGGTARSYLALGEALRRGRMFTQAAAVLEEGRLSHPGDAQLLVALAHAYHDAGQGRAAGRVMEEAALLDSKYRAEAAELHRRAGDVARALYLNVGLADQKAKARQRLGLFLQLGRLEQASALDPRLSRLGLLADEEVRYALAYAHYRIGDHDQATIRLRGITRPDLFDAAADLRRAIDAEREAPR